MSALPTAIKALYDLASAQLTGVDVFDGWGLSNTYGDNFLLVGVDDIADAGRGQAGQSTQAPGPMGTNRPRDERGSVFLVASSTNGDSDINKARTDVYTTVAAVEQIVRSNPSLGIAAGGLFVASFGDTHSLEQIQHGNGVTAVVRFSVAFTARI